MPAAPRGVTTDEQRAWLSAARRCGGRCAACGRPLAADEPVYVERFMLTRMVPVEAPIGAECASSGLLAETGGRDPERCAGCCRPIYYRAVRWNRRLALCSRRCRYRYVAARQAPMAREG